MFEAAVKQLTAGMASGVELCAALIIGLAVLRATVKSLLLSVRPAPGTDSQTVRLELGRWLALALEFELAADVLRTAVTPTWNDIGQLAAIAALRTLLNFFLQREIDSADRRGKDVRE